MFMGAPRGRGAPRFRDTDRHKDSLFMPHPATVTHSNTYLERRMRYAVVKSRHDPRMEIISKILAFAMGY